MRSCYLLLRPALLLGVIAVASRRCQSFSPIAIVFSKPASSLTVRSYAPMSSSSSSSSTPPPDRIDLIRNLLKSIETGDPIPIAAAVNEKVYKQHNPQTHEGSDGLTVLFQRLSKTNPKVNMVRGFQDGDYVFGQMEYDFSSRKICFEVFRFDENNQAVEHWDNIQPRQEKPNASGRSMVDGSTEVTDLDCTETNRQLVKSFIEEVLIHGNIQDMDTFIDSTNYAEHNPNLSDDLSTLKSQVCKTDGKTQQRVVDYQILHRILCQGNFVLSVSEGYRRGDQQQRHHTSFYDLFRIHNSKIVEHWDTTESVVPLSEWKNNNGKF